MAGDRSGEMLAVEVVRPRLVGGAERRAEAFGELRQVTVGDEGVAQGLRPAARRRGAESTGAIAPVWMPPVTAKFAPSAARPAGVFDRSVSGASPFSTARLLAVWAWTWSGASAQLKARPSFKPFVMRVPPARADRRPRRLGFKVHGRNSETGRYRRHCGESRCVRAVSPLISSAAWFSRSGRDCARRSGSTGPGR